MSNTPTRKPATYSYGATPTDVIKKVNGGKSYHMSLVINREKDSDFGVIKKVFDIGIDVHLEAITDTKLSRDNTQFFPRLNIELSEKDLLIVLRRLLELDTDEALSLRCDILSTLAIEEA